MSDRRNPYIPIRINVGAQNAEIGTAAEEKQWLERNIEEVFKHSRVVGAHPTTYIHMAKGRARKEGD